MSMKLRLVYFTFLLFLIFFLAYAFPWLFTQIADWQRLFNQLISDNLHHIQQHSAAAGVTLITASFLYGVIHALGPGHGKFIIASYLSTHESRLKQSIKLSVFSSLTQGIVAVVATSVVLIVLNLSSRYFKLSQLWLERGAFLLLAGLGLYWIYQGSRSWKKTSTTLFQINKLTPLSSSQTSSKIFSQSAVKNHRTFSTEHAPVCACGHQHLPNAQQLKKAEDWKSQLLVILSIGMRPCSGAIFVLFLSYMLDIYLWGVVATLAMSLGTGLMLALFAALVKYTRHLAIALGNWYGKGFTRYHSEALMKLVAGGIMLFFALALLYGTTLPMSGGEVLFAR